MYLNGWFILSIFIGAFIGYFAFHRDLQPAAASIVDDEEKARGTPTTRGTSARSSIVGVSV